MLCRVCQTMQKHMAALILSCSLEIICEIIICNSKEFIIKARTAWDIAHELHEIKNKSWLRTVAVGNNLMEGKALDWVSGEGRAWPGAEGGVLGLRRDHGRVEVWRKRDAVPLALSPVWHSSPEGCASLLVLCSLRILRKPLCPTSTEPAPSLVPLHSFSLYFRSYIWGCLPALTASIDRTMQRGHVFKWQSFNFYQLH